MRAARHRLRPVLAAAGLAAGTAAAIAAQPGAAAAEGALPGPLTSTPGDPARGRTIVADRRFGMCLLCQSGPFPEERFQGDLAPSLAGAGSRWSAAELRAQLLEPRRRNPDSVMPAYHRSEGLQRVGAAWRGRPILDAQQVEDVVAFLQTLRQP